jgi:hypothetical protein
MDVPMMVMVRRMLVMVMEMGGNMMVLRLGSFPMRMSVYFVVRIVSFSSGVHGDG